MKFVQKFLTLFVIFVLLFAFISNVKGVAYSGNWYDPTNYRFVGLFGNGYLTVRVARLDAFYTPVEVSNLSSLSFSISYFKLNNNTYTVGVSSIAMHYDYVANNKVLDITFKNVPSVVAGNVIEFQMSYSGYQSVKGGGPIAVSGNLYFKGKVGSIVSNGWFVYDLMEPSLNLSYNNDFLINSDGTASGSFSLTSSNFKINSVSNVQWVAGSSYIMGIYSWTATKVSDTNYTINVKFIKPTDGSYTIVVWATGQNTNDNTLLSMEAKATFTVSGASTPVASGTLVIVSPPDLYHINLPSEGQTITDITTNFTLVYGGNAINDFGADGSYSVSVVMVKSGDASKIVADVPISNTAWVYNSSTKTSMANFSYTWLRANDVSDYDVVFHAYIRSKTGIKMVYSQNTVEIILGSPSSSSGNVIIDFLKHLFEDFKNWFLSAMKYLFVPSPQQLQEISLTSSGGLSGEMKSYLPFLDLSGYGSSSVVLVKLSSLNNNYSDITINLNDSNLSRIFTFTKIATNTLISILLLLLIYEVLK